MCRCAGETRHGKLRQMRYRRRPSTPVRWTRRRLALSPCVHPRFAKVAGDNGEKAMDRRGDARVLGRVGPRRTLLGLALAGFSALAAPVGRAKFGRHRRHRRARRCPVRCHGGAAKRSGCYPKGAMCCPTATGGGACDAGGACCPPSVSFPPGTCAYPGSRCCSVASGGGLCPDSHPICCPATPQAPAGLCLVAGYGCCGAETNGLYCPLGTTCCAAVPGYPHGACVPDGTACPDSEPDPAAARHRLRIPVLGSDEALPKTRSTRAGSPRGDSSRINGG